MIRVPAGFGGEDRIKRYLDYYQPSYGVMMLSAGQFSPASLFAAGEQGVWYDPSDFSTMFQDSAGVTPVTAVEQPVGLTLDKSKGLALGAEQRANGVTGLVGTATAASYNTLTGIGSVNRVAFPSDQSFVQFSGLTASALYRVEFSAVSVLGVTVRSGDQAAAGVTFTAAILLGYVRASAGGLITVTSGANGTATFTLVSMRELPGNHASQSTSASCPVLSARVNLLTKTEQFDDAVWIAASSGTAALGVKTNDYGIAPDGTTTAARIQLDVSAGSVGNQSQVYQIANVSNGASYKYSAWIRTNDSSTKTIMAFSGGATVPTSLTVNGTWTRYEAARTVGGSTDAFQFILIKGTTSDTADLLVWHPDARAYNDGVGIPAYQRVNTSTDYDTTGFPYYLKFDGTDDSLATASVDFSATNAMSVFAGVRKLSDAARGMVVELGTGVSGSGAFSLNAPNAAANDISFRTAGTGTQAIATASGIAAPITRVLTGIGEIATDTCLLRGNGVQIATSATDQGAGNYINGALYIGRRNNATLPYNGRLYSLIVRGAQSTATEITNTETWVNGKTMAY